MERDSQIPVIANNDLERGAPEVADAVELGCGRIGLIYVHGHPVLRDSVARLYEVCLRILDRPVEEKKASAGGLEIWYQRGWTPPNMAYLGLAAPRVMEWDR